MKLKKLNVTIILLVSMVNSFGQTRVDSDAVKQLCSIFPDRYSQDVITGLDSIDRFLSEKDFSNVDLDSDYAHVFRELFFKNTMEKYRHYHVNDVAIFSDSIFIYSVDALIFLNFGDIKTNYKSISSFIVFNTSSKKIVLRKNNYNYFHGIKVSTCKKWTIYRYLTEEHDFKNNLRDLKSDINKLYRDMELSSPKIKKSDTLSLFVSNTRAAGYFYYGITYSEDFVERVLDKKVFVSNFQKFHRHEFVHFILNTRGINIENQILNEGIATLYGGSGGVSFTDLKALYILNNGIIEFEKFLDSDSPRAGTYTEKAIFYEAICNQLSNESSQNIMQLLSGVPKDDSPKEILNFLNIDIKQFKQGVIQLKN